MLSVKVARLLFGLAALASATGCGKPLTEDDCTALLDRYTEKVIDQARPKTKQAERSQLILKARSAAALDPEFAQCTRRVSRAKFECAMHAGNADEMERCLM